MSRYSDRLRRDLVREHSATLATTDRPEPARSGVLRRPRVLAGGSLGIAGVATGLVLALGAGGAAAPAAFAITRQADGTVLIHLGTAKDPNITELRSQLASMGIRETVGIDMATGAATTSGPVTCAMHAGATTPVKVLLGTDGTETISTGSTGAGGQTLPSASTGPGAFHLASCSAAGYNEPGNTGDEAPPVGAASLGAGS